MRMKIGYYVQYININSGLMQGGILSPLLFNIYINDLIKVLKTIAKTLAFADDLCNISEDKYILLNTIKRIINQKDNKIQI